MTGICEECDKVGRMVIRHKDGDHFNDAPVNRKTLCYRCHLVSHHRADEGNGRRAERLSLDWRPKPIPFDEIRRQYFACFPRA